MANHEGFFEPRHCPRGRTDCLALAQIIGRGHESFVCCGEHDGSAAFAQDRYRFCHKTPEPHAIDVLMNADERDLAHMAAVLSWASAATIPPAGEARVAVFQTCEYLQGQVEP